MNPTYVRSSGKIRHRRSCELPESAFIFKQVMLPEKGVNTFTTACGEQDMMSLLKFPNQKEYFNNPRGLNQIGKSDESTDNDELIFKEAIRFESPNSSRIKRHSSEEGNMVIKVGVENKARSKLAQHIRSNTANLAFKETLARIQTVEKLKGRARRDIRHKKFRVTPKPSTHVRFTISGSDSKGIQTQVTGSENRTMDENESSGKPSSRKPWQEKLWAKIQRSNSSHQNHIPKSSGPWKLFHIRSRSITSNTPNQTSDAKYHFRDFLFRNRSAKSQPKARRSGLNCRPTKSRSRSHKGHYCHYHYKNHRLREQQAFHRLKGLKQFCMPHMPNELPLTSRSLDEDAIMSTFDLDSTGITKTDTNVELTTTTPSSKIHADTVWTQHVQTTVTPTTKTGTSLQKSVTAASPHTDDDPTTENPTTTLTNQTDNKTTPRV